MRRGFTLLEVVVALAILSLAIMAIFDLNSGAVAMHGYAKRVTVASLLARSKMIDLEQALFDEGFSADDDEESGDFSEEGWPSFRWRARIIAPKTTGVSTEQLLGALFNLPTGGGGEGDLGVEGLATMFGGGGDAAAGAGALAGGAMAGMAQQQLTQFLEQITQTVREIHLTVSWRNGTEVETLDVVTHVVSMGPGSDRNGGQGGAAGGAPAPDQDPWVRVQGCTPIAGEPVQRNGTFWDPQNPNVQVVRRSICLANQGGGPGQPGQPRGGGSPLSPFGGRGRTQ